MQLQIMTSKKGTRVVTASNLHAVLQLADHHYSMNVRKWLDEIYEFADGIRKPIKMQDYAPRKIKDNPVFKDYYLSVELAKHITLNTKSKVKRKYARLLREASRQEQADNQLTKEQVETVMELTKAMCLLSNQESSEKKHLEIYARRNGGSAANWWKYRAAVLGYSARQLKSQLERIGQEIKGKNQQQMLFQLDPHELIRAGMIDLFLSMGKSAEFAQTMGDLAKKFAREMALEVVDDRQGPSLFSQEYRQKNGQLKAPYQLEALEKRVRV